MDGRGSFHLLKERLKVSTPVHDYDHSDPDDGDHHQISQYIQNLNCYRLRLQPLTLLPKNGSQSLVLDCPLQEDLVLILLTTPRPPEEDEDDGDDYENNHDQPDYHCLCADQF